MHARAGQWPFFVAVALMALLLLATGAASGVALWRSLGANASGPAHPAREEEQEDRNRHEEDLL